jgi:uncharacterized membrane protein YesL
MEVFLMNHEPKIIDMFSRIFELLLLNLLFVLTSLPLITIGASLTALFSVNLKLVRNEESYIIREYFRAFRRDLKPASVTFLLFAVTGTLFSFNIILALQSTGLLYLITGVLSLIFLILLGVYALYYFPLLARFHYTHAEAARYIPRAIAGKPGLFLMLIAMNLPVLFLCLFSIQTLLFVLIFTLLVGAAGFTYVESIVLRAVTDSLPDGH